MTKRDLPTPVSREDVYLAAILEELEGLRADMARAPEDIVNTTTGPIEFRGVDREPPPPGWAPSEEPPSGEPEKPKSKRRKSPPEPKNLAGTRKRR